MGGVVRNRNLKTHAVVSNSAYEAFKSFNDKGLEYSAADH